MHFKLLNYVVVVEVKGPFFWTRRITVFSPLSLSLSLSLSLLISLIVQYDVYSQHFLLLFILPDCEDITNCTFISFEISSTDFPFLVTYHFIISSLSAFFRPHFTSYLISTLPLQQTNYKMWNLCSCSPVTEIVVNTTDFRYFHDPRFCIYNIYNQIIMYKYNYIRNEIILRLLLFDFNEINVRNSHMHRTFKIYL